MDDAAFASINSFGGVDYAPYNKGINPVFRNVDIQDFAATEREGRPIFINREEVTLFIAGDPLSAATHPVDERIKRRFKEQYEKWKRDKTGAHIVGMPLSKWPMATPVMIRELEFINVFSVEDLSVVSDANVTNFSNGREMREKAIAYLAAAKDGAAAMRYAADNQRLRDEMAELRKFIVGNDGVDLPPPKPSIHVPRILTKKRKINKRKSSWTPERRAAASEVMKARHATKAVTPLAGLQADVQV